MCFHCPTHLAVGSDLDIRITRIAESDLTPADVAHSPRMLAEFDAGDRFLIALQATVYIQNRPVVTQTLHGVMESDLPGDIACAFQHEGAVESVVRMAVDCYSRWAAHEETREPLSAKECGRPGEET